MVHQGSGNGDFSWNELCGGGGGGAPHGGELIDISGYDFLFQDMEPPNNETTTSSCKQSPPPQPSSIDEQEKLVEKLKQLGPLGLKLTIAQHFLDSINSVLLSQSQAANNTHSRNRNHRRDSSHHHHHRVAMMPQPHHQPRQNDFLSQPVAAEKMKAANFPTLSLKIGNWERVSIHEGDLVAKLYYAKRKLVWEFLERSLKRKIEIQWIDITAIRATLKDNEPGILQIELRKPPSFFDEIDPQPRKHTNWRNAQDFTGGQALLCRRHCLRFPAGILDKHYEKLLQCDSRLLQLSQQPFPSSKCNRYFNCQSENMYNFADYSINFKPEIPTFNVPPPQVQAYHQQMINTSLFNLRSPDSVIELAHMSDHNGNVLVGNGREFHGQGANSFAEGFTRDQFQGRISNMAPTGTTSFVYQNNNYVDANLFFDEIEKNLLTDCSNQQQQQQQYYRDYVAPMDALVNLYHRGNPSCNIDTNQHLSYEHNTAAATIIMHNVNQYSADSTELVYPPHPNSWVPQPVSVVTLPQNMAQSMSHEAVPAAALPQNMAQLMSHQPPPQDMSQAMPHQPQNMAQPMSHQPPPQNMSQAMSHQPVSMAAQPQNMTQPMSHQPPPQNMSQPMSYQPVSMAAQPQNMEEDTLVNLPQSSNSLDQMIDDNIATMNGNNIANNNNNNWPM
ncbi:hypothetical protein ACOSQ2_009117 [Xanthoceras sorbifolium]